MASRFLARAVHCQIGARLMTTLEQAESRRRTSCASINITPKAGLPVLRARLIHSSVHLNRWRRFFDPQPAPNGQGLHRTAEGQRR